MSMSMDSVYSVCFCLSPFCVLYLCLWISSIQFVFCLSPFCVWIDEIHRHRHQTQNGDKQKTNWIDEIHKHRHKHSVSYAYVYGFRLFCLFFVCLHSVSYAYVYGFRLFSLFFVCLHSVSYATKRISNTERNPSTRPQGLTQALMNNTQVNA
jgi:hypothetical protein